MHVEGLEGGSKTSERTKKLKNQKNELSQKPGGGLQSGWSSGQRKKQG